MGYFKNRWREQPPWVKIPLYALLGIAAAVGFGLLFGIVVRELWNWLMPMIFGLPEITFWQSVGLFILAKLIFGGFGGSHSESDHPKPPHGKDHHGPMDHCRPDHHRPMGHPDPMRRPGPPPADPHDPMHRPGPPPMDHHRPDHHGPDRGFQSWRHYDDWWESEGKEAFEQYAKSKRPAPPAPEPTEELPEDKTEE